MVDFVALVTPPKLVGPDMKPANGDIYVRSTNSISKSGVIVVPFQVHGKIVEGEFQALDGGPLMLVVTPEGVALEIVVEIFQDTPSGRRDKHTIRRTVSTPNASTVTWDALTDVVPVESGPDMVRPAWANLLDAKADEAIAASDVAVMAAAGAESSRDAAQQAATAAQAVGTTNDTVIAGRINDSSSATNAALAATIVVGINEPGTPLREAVQGAAIPASETVPGVVELATVTETATGIDTSRAVTPAGVKTAIAAVNLSGTYAGRPAASTVPAGTLYFCTNVPETYRSNGAAWSVVGAGGNELGVAQLASGTTRTTTSTSPTDIPGLTVTFVAGERPVELRFMADVNNSATSVTVVYFDVAGVTINSSGYQPPTAGRSLTVYGTARQSGLTPGATYTAKMRFAVGGGTGTIGSVPSPSTFQVVTL